MTAKSEHDHSFEIAGFITLDTDLKLKLKYLVQALLDSAEAERWQRMEDIVQMVSEACENSWKHPLYKEYAALLIDYLLSYFLEVRSSHESTFIQFLNLLNHLPITLESPLYKPLVQAMTENAVDPQQNMTIFDRLQALYLLTEIKDFANARLMYQEMEPMVPKENLKLWVVLQISRIRLLKHEDNLPEVLRLHLQSIMEAWTTEGCECSINFILRWILSINWQKQLIIKKTLMMRIYERICETKNLTCAMVIYELFSLEDRLVPYPEKISYQKRLIKFPGSILNVQQLHNLYFFAGYYFCGVLSHFKDSIQNYQYSNYFLHKSWDRLIHMSQFLRLHLNADAYYHAMPYLDARIQDLSNQVSLQNNTYVESLQANFDKIEELYQKVGELSLTDSLTGLRNRRFFYDNLQQMIVLAARHRVPICFCIVDIDFFKLVNDNFGHLAGDYVLKELSQMLSQEFRKSDVIVRYGGEEFLIILFDIDTDSCLNMMEIFRQKVERHTFEFRSKLMAITISIGITGESQIDHQCGDLSQFVSQADKALYMAKSKGRNQVVLFDPELNNPNLHEPT